MVLECRIQAGLEDNTISWDRAGSPLRETEEGGHLEIRSVVMMMMMIVMMVMITPGVHPLLSSGRHEGCPYD